MKALMTFGGRRQRHTGSGAEFSQPRRKQKTRFGSPVSIIHTTTYRRRERTLDAVVAIGFVAICALLGWAGASFL